MQHFQHNCVDHLQEKRQTVAAATAARFVFRITEENMRKLKYKDVDAALFRWFREVRAQSMPVSGPMLQQKAKSLGALLGHDDFNLLNGWIQRFKDHHGISCKVVCRESGDTDESINVWLRLSLENTLSPYTDRDIYNATKVAYFIMFCPTALLH